MLRFNATNAKVCYFYIYIYLVAAAAAALAYSSAFVDIAIVPGRWANPFTR